MIMMVLWESVVALVVTMVGSLRVYRRVSYLVNLALSFIKSCNPQRRHSAIQSFQETLNLPIVSIVVPFWGVPL